MPCLWPVLFKDSRQFCQLVKEIKLSSMRIPGIIAYTVIILLISAVAISVTIVSKGSYKSSLYYRFTKQRFAWIVSDPFPKHAIEAGWAKVTIPPKEVAPPSADQLPHKRDSIQTRALVLDNGTTRAVMITVDLQMMPPKVAQALEKRLPKLGFTWKNVYLGASYSQPSLGGWAEDYKGQQYFGPYDQQLIDQLTECIIKAVELAQKNVSTTQIGYTQIDVKDQQRPTLTPDATDKAPLHLVKLRKVTGESALIYSTSAALITVDMASNPANKPPLFSQLTQTIERQTRCFTLGLVGTIQFTKSPAYTARQSVTQAKQIDALAAQVAAAVARQSLHTDSTLITQTAPLIQNDPQIRISPHWRLKPWLAKTLYGNYNADLKALRIGETVFLGYPGGLSSELATDLLALPAASNRQLVVTSYNGGNIGHIVPDAYYFAEKSPYALDQMNRFGPYTAEFFEDMTQSLVTSLK
ncbi:MAG TPA: neutral/alkaline non-lysosomal ceramidase N-terminal domain-containing protein [Fibrella sp.]